MMADRCGPHKSPSKLADVREGFGFYANGLRGCRISGAEKNWAPLILVFWYDGCTSWCSPNMPVLSDTDLFPPAAAPIRWTPDMDLARARCSNLRRTVINSLGLVHEDDKTVCLGASCP